MKSFTINCLIIFMVLAISKFSQSQNIFTTVDGNNVTLWETGAQRNCGAVYDMAVNLNDHYIKWVQLDTGMVAFCLCVYDLSVTYGPLEPGDYTVDLYYTLAFEPDEIYEGSTGFTIGGSRDNADGGIISQYQSDCYTGIDDPGLTEEFRLYPIPLADGALLNVEATSTGNEFIMEIFTLTGNQIFNKQYDGNCQIRDSFIKDELFPVPGIYMVRLKTSANVYVRKITVL